MDGTTDLHSRSVAMTLRSGSLTGIGGISDRARKRALVSIVSALLMAASSVWGTGALAQAAKSAPSDYPNKPIRLLVTVASGGLADVIGRLVTDKMAIALGQPFVYEHRPGAGGNLAMESTVRAAPDGYTLLLAGTQSAINGSMFKNLPFDPSRDLAPVGGLGKGSYAMYASATLPASNIAELIAYAKANPGKLNYGSAGVGSGAHLTAVLFTLAAGVELTHVPYKGIQAMVPDLISGQVQLVFNALGPLEALARTGKVKLIGISNSQRLGQYPEVPTLAEQGLPGFEVVGWYMLLAPSATPREILLRLNRSLASSYGDPAEFEKKTSMQPLSLTLDEGSRFFADESAKWARAVKASGATAQ
jgi:tripartite-type tricarboxylate transporter receptor subunit TctC